MSSRAIKVSQGEQFEFGGKRRRFLSQLNDARIAEAEQSLKTMLGIENLSGKSFLDIGSGTGLSSLAARRLGARVHSFDDDSESVACAVELRRRYFPPHVDWKIEAGSVLDEEFIKSLGTFDVVYAWGVLHHTGEMWRALENAALPVAASGKLLIAIHNDAGNLSARWKRIKRTYHSLPGMLKAPFAALAVVPAETKAALHAAFMRRDAGHGHSWTRRDPHGSSASRWQDIMDWMGGYPYEVATPDQIFDFYRARGFTLIRLKCGHQVGLGCNEFVFVRGQRRVNKL